MKITARGNQDEQRCKITPHRSARNLLQEHGLDGNCVFLSVRTAQLDEKTHQSQGLAQLGFKGAVPGIIQVTLRKSLLPLRATFILFFLSCLSRLKTHFYHGQSFRMQSSCDEDILGTVVDYRINMQGRETWAA